MTQIESESGAAGVRGLKIAAVAWSCVAAIGIWIFGYYIAALYGVGALRDGLQAWNTVMPDGHGYVPGDAVGDIALGVHLAMAFAVTAAGVFQLIPQVRARAPRLHRWNGRVFLTAAMVASVTGLFIAFFRGAVAGGYMTAGNALNTALILTCGGMAWRTARARRFAAHRRWAMRAFVVIYAVWFYRLGMMLWLTANQGPVGHTDAFDGPFDIFLAFAHVLLPLGIMELYLAARDRGAVIAKRSMTAALAGLTLATALGVAAATAFMWLPQL